MTTPDSQFASDNSIENENVLVSAETEVSAPDISLTDTISDYMLRAINNADETAAQARVDNLRDSHPQASADELVELLITQKCLQTGTIGAITSGTAVIPGIGTFTALTFGVALDIGLTFKLQAELVLEIAAVYEHQLDEQETA